MNDDLLEAVACQWEKGFLRRDSQYELHIIKHVYTHYAITHWDRNKNNYALHV